ncbi:hypothetical protein [Rhizobium leguminosarum]|uniref:hypothetical protein n=1 Tax=Rhizobium leguminosarum TaxID=384 RepID=UPI0011D06BCD|nr:hypothetical protein [Rhizobium leguminosarum]
MRYREIAGEESLQSSDNLSGLHIAFLFPTFSIRLDFPELTLGGRRLSAPAFPVGATSATSRQALILLSFFSACRLFSSDKRDKQTAFRFNLLQTLIFLLVSDKLATSATSIIVHSPRQAKSAR